MLASFPDDLFYSLHHLFKYLQLTETMATPAVSTQALLGKLATSLESAITALPTAAAIVPPADGISLLDVKSELLLSYLQNLVFLILVKIRNTREPAIANVAGETEDEESVADDIVKKLVELRVYLEKGVRPLESKLKYQVDKVLRAADTSDRVAITKPSINKNSKKAALLKAAVSGDVSDLEADEDAEDDSEDGSSEIDELSYRPNPAAFARPGAAASATSRTTTKAKPTSSDGIYRPPRITPTSLPTSSFGQFNDRNTSKRAAKPQRSSAVDEYINNELSTAPIAEPSIGTTIVSGGRRVKSAAERTREAERQTYEESNFVRLPKESKKIEAQRRAKDRNTFGGEEMRGLGEGLDRIERLTGKRKGGAGGGRDTLDGPRGEGFAGRGGKRRKVGKR